MHTMLLYGPYRKILEITSIARKVWLVSRSLQRHRPQPRPWLQRPPMPRARPKAMDMALERGEIAGEGEGEEKDEGNYVGRERRRRRDRSREQFVHGSDLTITINIAPRNRRPKAGPNTRS